MNIQAVNFQIEKAGNSPDQYEDACSFDLEVGRLAIADGASSAYDSKRWAKLLVDKFVTSPPDFSGSDFDTWIDALSLEWSGTIDWNNLPYYKYNKAQEGSFATFLGVQLEVVADGDDLPQVIRWHALAVGDCAMLLVRNQELVMSFPMAFDAVFDNTPNLISTLPSYNYRSLKEIRTDSGELLSGDVVFIATDSVAEWLLTSMRQGEWSGETMLAALDGDCFGTMIQQLRTDGRIKNDDSTVVLLRVGGPTAQDSDLLGSIWRQEPTNQLQGDTQTTLDPALMAAAVIFSLCVAVLILSPLVGIMVIVLRFIHLR